MTVGVAGVEGVGVAWAVPDVHATMASAATTSKLRILMDERHPAAAVTRAPSASGSSARRWKRAGRECRQRRPTVARVGRERRQWRS